MDRSNGPEAPARDQPGNRPALLIIDMINSFDFPGADRVKPKAADAAATIVKLKAQMRRAGFPIIYVNDNFGAWHSEQSRLVETALAHPNPVSEMLRPDDDDYFIIKPQFSGFYATNLPVLLPKLGVNRLILTGIATDICILFTAADAHMRDYALWVAEDAVAAECDTRGQSALQIMRDAMAAETAASEALNLRDWMERLDERNEQADRK